MTLKINGATGGSVSLDAPDNTSPAGTDVTLTLPTTAGSSGQYLQTNGSGTLSWQTVASDAITEGNTTVECVDTGSDGHITFDTEGSERARFDSSGRLLVGTTTARTNLVFGSPIQLEGTELGNRSLAVISSSNSGVRGGVLVLAHQKSGTLGGNTALASGDSQGIISFEGSDGTNFLEGARIEAFVDGTPGASDMPGRLYFATTADGASSPTTRMRMFQSGIVDIWNSPSFIPANDNVTSLGKSGQRWTAVWAANGTIQTSDERAKTNIAESSLGSDFIKSLRPVSYKWIDGGKVDTGERDEENSWVLESVPGQRTHWGFIAQEVKEAVDAAGVDFGGWVLTDKDDPDSEQALRYDQFIAPLTKALQEALAKIETLETANASQAATIAALDARLTALEGGAA